MRDIAVSHLPVGYGFRPTDEELVGYYLKMKLQGRNSEVDKVIAEVDICKWDPWELPGLSKIKSDDPKWFFVSPSDYKYHNSNRANRTTHSGRWKVTGKERNVTHEATKDIIGKKRTLVFYKGLSPGKKTDWVMHEYYYTNQRTFTMYRLKNKSDEKTDPPNRNEDEPINHMRPEFDDQAPHNMVPLMHSPPEVDLESLFNTEPESDVLASDNHVNHTSGLQTLFGSNEWDDEEATQLLQSVIIDEADYYREDITPTHFSDSNLPASLKRSHVYDGGVSSDTDIEVFQQQPFQDLEIPRLPNESAGSKRFRHMKMVNQPRQTERVSFSNHFNENEVHDEIYHMESATDNESAVDPLDNHQFLQDSTPEINCLEIGSNEDPIVGILFELRNKPKSDNLIKTVKVEREVEHTNEVWKESKSKGARDPVRGRIHDESWFDSDKDSKTVGVTSRKKDLMLATKASSRGNWMGFFTFQETSSLLSRKSHAPAVYFFNALIGMCLFVFFVREVVLYGQWF